MPTELYIAESNVAIPFDNLQLARDWLEQYRFVSEGIASPCPEGYVALYENAEGVPARLIFERTPGRIDEPTVDVDLEEEEWAAATEQDRNASHQEWNEDDEGQIEMIF